MRVCLGKEYTVSTQKEIVWLKPLHDNSLHVLHGIFVHIQLECAMGVDFYVVLGRLSDWINNDFNELVPSPSVAQRLVSCLRITSHWIKKQSVNLFVTTALLKLVAKVGSICRLSYFPVGPTLRRGSRCESTIELSNSLNTEALGLVSANSPDQ